MANQKELLTFKAGLPQAAPTPTTFQRDFEYIRQTQGEEAAQKYLQNKIDPPVWKQDAYGQWRRIDTSGSQQDFGAYNPDEWEVVE